MDYASLFLVFFKSSALAIGGLGSLPLLRQDLVATGFATDEQIVAALAIGRLSPGPNGLFMVSLGYQIAGWIGALLATVAVTLPPLAIIPAIALTRRWLLSTTFAGVVRGVTLGTAGLILATALQLTTPGIGTANEFHISPWQVALAVLTVGMALRGNIHPALLVAIGAVVGNVFIAFGY